MKPASRYFGIAGEVVAVEGAGAVVPTPLFSPPFGATAAPLLLVIELVVPVVLGGVIGCGGELDCAMAAPDKSIRPAVAATICRMSVSLLLGSPTDPLLRERDAGQKVRRCNRLRHGIVWTADATSIIAMLLLPLHGEQTPRGKAKDNDERNDRQEE
jgi:hypothetical protein